MLRLNTTRPVACSKNSCWQQTRDNIGTDDYLLPFAFVVCHFFFFLYETLRVFVLIPMFLPWLYVFACCTASCCEYTHWHNKKKKQKKQPSLQEAHIPMIHKRKHTHPHIYINKCMHTWQRELHQRDHAAIICLKIRQIWKHKYRLAGRRRSRSSRPFFFCWRLRKETLIPTMQRFVVHGEHEKNELLWLSLTAAVYL